MPEFMVHLTTARLPGSEAAEQPQTVTLPPNVSVGVMFCYCSLLLLHKMQRRADPALRFYPLFKKQHFSAAQMFPRLIFLIYFPNLPLSSLIKVCYLDDICY